MLDGVYVWNWYGYGGPATTSYTPRGKPAEVEVRALLERVSEPPARSEAALRSTRLLPVHRAGGDERADRGEGGQWQA